MLYALQQQVQALCCIHQWFYCTPCQITFLFCHEARSPSPELLLSCLVYLSRPGASLGRFSSPHYLAPRLPPRPPSIFPLQHVVLFLIWRGIFTDSACNFFLVCISFALSGSALCLGASLLDKDQPLRSSRDSSVHLSIYDGTAPFLLLSHLCTESKSFGDAGAAFTTSLYYVISNI